MRLVVGRIGKAHGIRGEVNVTVRTDDPEARFAIGSVIDTDPIERGPLTVSSARTASARMVIGFEGLDNRSAADSLRGTLLIIDTADLPDLQDDDDFYDHELIGMQALHSDGHSIGIVIDILHGAAGDTVVLKPADQSGKSELLVPFVRSIVPNIDRANRQMTIDPPEGLLDL